MSAALLRSWLADPTTAGRPVDDPGTTELRRAILREKRSLNRIYRQWYREIMRNLPEALPTVLELGSGPGFFKSLLPGLITSDILPLSRIDLVADAVRLPLGDASLDGIVLVNVFHHIRDPRAFLTEAGRCVVPSGVVCMVEPWVTAWARLVYRLHSEPFQPDSRDWVLEEGGPLSAGNGALPWIVFQRDRSDFERNFPEWEVVERRPMMPFRYLFSGGVSLRQLAPDWAFRPLEAVEWALRPMNRWLAMFALIVLRRR